MAEKSQALKYILIGVAITVGLGVCGVGSCVALLGGGAFWAFQELDAPAQEAKLFFTDIAAGKVAAARERTSKRFRAGHTLQRFEELVQAQPPLQTTRDVSLPNRGMMNGRARLAGTLTTSSGTTGVEIELVEENKQWRIDLLSVAGTPLD